MMNCPNCTCDNIYRLHPGCRLNKCTDCGTTWFDGSISEALVPRRSQPATVLPLPDESCRVWTNEHGQIAVVGGRSLRLFHHDGTGGSRYDANDYATLGKRWTPWTPPILPPQTRDEDAEALRCLAADMDGRSRGALPSSADIRRIADRLEKGQAQP